MAGRRPCQQWRPRSQRTPGSLTLETGAHKTSARSRDLHGAESDAPSHAQDTVHAAQIPARQGKAGGWGGGPASRSPEIGEFEQFYREFMPRLVSYLGLSGGNSHLASEMAQEAMIELYKNWSTIENPKAWAFTVARRILFREKRKSSYVKEVLTAIDPEVAIPSKADEFTDSEYIWKALRELPSRQKQALSLKLQGFSTDEIAAFLDINSNTVRSSIRHARKALSEKLKPE
ncbi:RNA polymerase sigma factor [Streptomyces agglomeratus]|uniref:RNA polymerase sigma factor n=1 Tax=Streptomyces agglomeratus TaxID=285458 RepID=UPI00210EF1BA|nr:RNA polymerase sigma factor [Streptomyces agglomeratus]